MYDQTPLVHPVSLKRIATLASVEDLLVKKELSSRKSTLHLTIRSPIVNSYISL